MSTAQIMERKVIGPDAANLADALAASFAECRTITKSRARNFYYGLRLTPEPKRSAIFSIYAWMRDGDDRVDSAASTQAAQRALAEFAEATQRVLHDSSGLHIACGMGGYWPAFARTVAAYDIERDITDSMLRGLAADLEVLEYESTHDVRTYCYNVASTAGLACVRIWGLRPEITAGPHAAAMHQLADQKAIARGIAFQRTNILRDITEDSRATPPRCYIARQMLAQHGLTARTLAGWENPANCLTLIEACVHEARQAFDDAEGLEAMLDPSCAASLWGMTRIYRGILEMIAADPARAVVGPRARLTAASKAAIALTAFVRAQSVSWAMPVVSESA